MLVLHCLKLDHPVDIQGLPPLIHCEVTLAPSPARSRGRPGACLRSRGGWKHFLKFFLHFQQSFMFRSVRLDALRNQRWPKWAAVVVAENLQVWGHRACGIISWPLLWRAGIRLIPKLVHRIACKLAQFLKLAVIQEANVTEGWITSQNFAHERASKLHKPGPTSKRKRRAVESSNLTSMIDTKCLSICWEKMEITK